VCRQSGLERRLWSAPAERSGDGALDLLCPMPANPKRSRAPLGRRTPTRGRLKTPPIAVGGVRTLETKHLSAGTERALQDNLYVLGARCAGWGFDRHLSPEYCSPMSKAEIFDEIMKLTSEERWEVRLKLAELDGDGWMDDDDPLTDEQKALLEARLADLEQHPEKSIPWEEAKRRIEERFTK